MNIDGSAIKLGDIVPAGEDAGWGQEFITTFDQDLYVDGEFTYYCEDYGMELGAGWYNEDSELCNDVEIGFGKGAQIETGGLDVIFKGEVNKGNTDGKIVIDNLNVGFTTICNPTPVELDIQDFIPVSDEVEVGWGQEFITTFDQDLYVELELTYYCEDYGMDDGAGWYNEDGERVTYPIPSGYGFNIEVSSEGIAIEIPSPIKDTQE